MITSLPDQSELAALSFEEWERWFVSAARAIFGWLPADGSAIFYQRDVRRDGRWIDKSQLILQAAQAESFALIWHKIVCRRAPDTADRDARPGYSHLLCLQRTPRAPRKPLPDVLTDAGVTAWSRGMGYAACRLACDHLRNETATRSIIDPFCGRGSVLAVAAALGFEVLGIELNARRSRAARSLLARTLLTQTVVERGAQLFDAGEFFAAHEVWEERWRTSRDARERLGLQGLIQIAAAFHKLFVMHSPEAATRLLARGLDKLERTGWLPGIDVEAVRDATRAYAAALAAGSCEASALPRLLSAR